MPVLFARHPADATHHSPMAPDLSGGPTLTAEICHRTPLPFFCAGRRCFLTRPLHTPVIAESGRIDCIRSRSAQFCSTRGSCCGRPPRFVACPALRAAHGLKHRLNLQNHPQTPQPDSSLIPYTDHARDGETCENGSGTSRKPLESQKLYGRVHLATGFRESLEAPIRAACGPVPKHRFCAADSASPFKILKSLEFSCARQSVA